VPLVSQKPWDMRRSGPLSGAQKHFENSRFCVSLSEPGVRREGGTGATTGNDVAAKPTGYSEPLAQAINCGDAHRAAKLIQDALGIEDRGLLSSFVTEHRRFAPPRFAAQHGQQVLQCTAQLMA
jgi:hypothetical protein